MDRRRAGRGPAQVEGSDDVKFWSPRAGRTVPGVEVLPAGGRPTLVEAVVKLDGLAVVGVLGIIDAEFDHVMGRSLQSANLVRTDACDLECLLVCTPALGKVLAELGDEVKINVFEHACGSTVQQALLARAMVWGTLRWACEVGEWKINFDKLKPSQRFVDEALWRVDDACVRAAFLDSCHAPSAEALDATLVAQAKVPHRMACQGHDLMRLLALGLRAVLGTLAGSRGPKDIATLLRASCDSAHLSATDLARDIRTWEARNKGFSVVV